MLVQRLQALAPSNLELRLRSFAEFVGLHGTPQVQALLSCVATDLAVIACSRCKALSAVCKVLQLTDNTELRLGHSLQLAAPHQHVCAQGAVGVDMSPMQGLSDALGYKL